MAAAGVFAGCQVDAEFGAACTTSPPIPHHSIGVILVSADLPPRVEAGSTFTVTVDMMGADAGVPGGETMPTGTLDVSGGVSPSGGFAVGQGPFGGPAFPVELEFTATGEPGDTITFQAVRGSAVLGTLPNAALVTCNPVGEAVIATTEITAPEP